MENIIDYIKNGRGKISRILDFLSDQLEQIHKGEDVNYLTLLDAVNFIETCSDSFLVPKEDELFHETCEKYNFHGFNCLINQYRAENAELKTLTKSLREYLKAALADVVYEKARFEQQLDTCIQREREHIDTEINTILPLAKLMITNQQIKKLSKRFQLGFNSNDDVNNIAVTSEVYQLAKEESQYLNSIN